MEPGITAIPCASGWCGKVIENVDGSDGKIYKTKKANSF